MRENRTYDQILGDDPRGDGDPKLTLFGEKITPNAHALAKRFPLLDHVYANSEASIDGHFWTSAGAVSDYVTKNWHQNYGGRKRPYDFGVYSVTWPSQRFLFDQAEQQGISYFNYGEAIAGTVPLTDKDRNPEETAAGGAQVRQVRPRAAHARAAAAPPAPCFSNDASSGGTNVITRPGGLRLLAAARRQPARPPRAGSSASASASSSRCDADAVPKFNYITLPNDHTAGTTPGGRTPSAMIAENDLALGRVRRRRSRSRRSGTSR